jgi:hypothetical protein
MDELTRRLTIKCLFNNIVPAHEGRFLDIGELAEQLQYVVPAPLPPCDLDELSRLLQLCRWPVVEVQQKCSLLHGGRGTLHDWSVIEMQQKFSPLLNGGRATLNDWSVMLEMMGHDETCSCISRLGVVVKEPSYSVLLYTIIFYIHATNFFGNDGRWWNPL